MNKVFELKKKLSAFKKGIKYISMTQEIKNEALSNILSSSNLESKKKQFTSLKEDDLIKEKI